MPESARRTRRARTFVISVAACVVIVVGGALLAYGASLMRVSTAQGETDAPERLPNVVILPLEAITVQDALRLTGGVEPWHDMTLSAEVGGRITEQPVHEGQRVAAGDVIARIDTELLSAHMDEIEARLSLAREDATRLQRLRERGAGTPQDADRADTEVRVLEATLRTARINLDKSTLRAPVDAVIDTLHQEEGEFVDAGFSIARLVQVDRLKVEVGVPERDVPYFSPGESVGITLDALPGRSFEGVIHRIATTASPGTRTFKTEIEVANADGSLLPGMIARVGLLRQEFPNSMLIPISAIIPLEDRRIVLIERDGIAELREIEVGLVQGASVQVLSGLEAGEHLIVTGQREVRPGHGVAVRQMMTHDGHLRPVDEEDRTL